MKTNKETAKKSKLQAQHSQVRASLLSMALLSSANRTPRLREVCLFYFNAFNAYLQLFLIRLEGPFHEEHIPSHLELTPH